MTNLCLTLDYELFGSGKGDVFQHIIEPTNRLLEICRKGGIKLSIFFEVVEYWKIKEAYESGISMGYNSNPAAAMEEQITRAFKEGHDVQLHVHPQWIDAKYVDGQWMLDMDYWRLPEVPSQANGKISMGLTDLIKKGKQTLENLLQPVNPDYKCNILRAGGYNIDPSGELIRVLRQNGFIADCSVFHGGNAVGSLSSYDYSHVEDTTPYWFCSDDSLLQQSEAPTDFVELMIFAQKMRRIFKYDSVRVKTALRNKEHAVDKFKNNSAKKSKWETIQFYLSREAVIWDFCLFSKGKMKRYMKRALKVKKQSTYEFHPFVLVGHPKDFGYTNALDWLVQNKQKYDIAYSTLTEIVGEIRVHNIIGSKINQNTFLTNQP